MARAIDLGSVTKMAAALAALAYGTGVIAINTYLHGLGITDFSFAKPKLLLTGTVVLSSFLLLASAPLFIAWSYCVRSDGKEKETTRSLDMLVVGIVALALLVFAACRLCFGLDTQMGKLQAWWLWEHLSHDGAMQKTLAVFAIVSGAFSPGCAAAFFVYRAKHFWTRAKPVDGGACIPLEYFHFAGAMAVVLASFIGYIMIFAFVFYPSIPVEYGGGEPYFESFAIAEEQVCLLQRIGIPFDRTRHGITQPLPVLHETDALVAIWLQGEPDQSGVSASHTPKATPEDGDQDQESNLTGLGDYKLVVVQIDQNAIVAARAYPRYPNLPDLVRTPTGCGGAGKSASAHAEP